MQHLEGSGTIFFSVVGIIIFWKMVFTAFACVWMSVRGPVLFRTDVEWKSNVAKELWLPNGILWVPADRESTESCIKKGENVSSGIVEVLKCTRQWTPKFWRGSQPLVPLFPSSEETLYETKFPDFSVSIVVPEFCFLLMRAFLDGLEDSSVEVCRSCVVWGGRYSISKLLSMQQLNTLRMNEKNVH